MTGTEGEPNCGNWKYPEIKFKNFSKLLGFKFSQVLGQSRRHITYLTQESPSHV